MPSLTREEAIRLLRKNRAPENVIEHCITVSAYASEIARKVHSKGHRVDVNFVETAALLHDIGRSVTHGIRHGVEGARILKDYPEYARVAESHIGGGVTKEEAVELGLPARDFLPETLEEKIVCLADKRIYGVEKASLEDTLAKFEKRLGKGHPTVGRIRRLYEEIRGLM